MKAKKTFNMQKREARKTSKRRLVLIITGLIFLIFYAALMLVALGFVDRAGNNPAYSIIPSFMLLINIVWFVISWDTSDTNNKYSEITHFVPKISMGLGRDLVLGLDSEEVRYKVYFQNDSSSPAYNIRIAVTDREAFHLVCPSLLPHQSTERALSNKYIDEASGNISFFIEYEDSSNETRTEEIGPIKIL